MSRNFLKIISLITLFCLKSSIEPEIFLLVSFYLPFNFFVSETCSCKQTHIQELYTACMLSVNGGSNF